MSEPENTIEICTHGGWVGWCIKCKDDRISTLEAELADERLAYQSAIEISEAKTKGYNRMKAQVEALANDVRKLMRDVGYSCEVTEAHLRALLEASEGGEG